MQQGQKELLQALYVEHQGILRIAAYQYGLPKAEADDAVQDTFCAFIEAYLSEADKWEEKRIKATLMKILRNRCMDYYRSSNRHPSISIQEFMQGGEHCLTSEFHTTDIAGSLAEKEEMARLREGVLSMSSQLQDVLVLYMLEERPIGEVCRILHITEASCRMRIARIRKYLTNWMLQEETAAGVN